MLPVKPLRFPDFIGIGAQKAGTTWLDRMLRRHPDIWLPPTKEVHFFNRLSEQRDANSKRRLRRIDKGRADSVLKSIRHALDSRESPAKKMAKICCLSLIGALEPTDETYGRIFQFAPEGALCGEITPNYARLPDEAVRHMLHLQPGLKLIFMIRDPIERDWSHLRMQNRRNELQDLSYRERLSHSAMFGYSDYMSTIERFGRLVPTENFLIAYFDDLVDRPEKLLQQICAFLEIDFERGDFSDVNKSVNVGQTDPIPPDLYDTLRESLAPVYQGLLSLNNPIVQQWHRKHYENQECRA